MASQPVKELYPLAAVSVVSFELGLREDDLLGSHCRRIRRLHDGRLLRHGLVTPTWELT